MHIGDRVPVITTTAAATDGFISESVTYYLDIGLKLEVEPVIYLQDDDSSGLHRRQVRYEIGCSESRQR